MKVVERVIRRVSVLERVIRRVSVVERMCGRVGVSETYRTLDTVRMAIV